MRFELTLIALVSRMLVWGLYDSYLGFLSFWRYLVCYCVYCVCVFLLYQRACASTQVGHDVETRKSKLDVLSQDQSMASVRLHSFSTERGYSFSDQSVGCVWTKSHCNLHAVHYLVWSIGFTRQPVCCILALYPSMSREWESCSKSSRVPIFIEFDGLGRIGLFPAFAKYHF